jgi:transglutaminase-like putative cysteine protease
MQLHIRHETTYRYEHPVKYSIQSLRLTPRNDAGQRALSWRITAPGRCVEQHDAHGNVAHLLTYEESHREISIVVQGVVDTGPDGAPLLPDEGPLAPLAYLGPTPLTRVDARVRDFAAASLGGTAPLRERLVRLASALHGAIRYVRGVTDVSDDAATVLERGQGVCQDHAHAFIACCRSAGIPARYVSGYFYTGDAGEVASHAWADAWLGAEQGWLSIDLTHDSLAGERHCRLAIGRDYRDAAPVRGVRSGGGGEALHVAVVVAASAQQQQ